MVGRLVEQHQLRRPRPAAAPSAARRRSPPEPLRAPASSFRLQPPRPRPPRAQVVGNEIGTGGIAKGGRSPRNRVLAHVAQASPSGGFSHHAAGYRPEPVRPAITFIKSIFARAVAPDERKPVALLHHEREVGEHRIAAKGQRDCRSIAKGVGACHGPELCGPARRGVIAPPGWRRGHGTRAWRRRWSDLRREFFPYENSQSGRLAGPAPASGAGVSLGGGFDAVGRACVGQCRPPRPKVTSAGRSAFFSAITASARRRPRRLAGHGFQPCRAARPPPRLQGPVRHWQNENARNKAMSFPSRNSPMLTSTARENLGGRSRG